MLLFYVRHGDPVYNPDSLTALGRRQAEAVAHRLARYGVNRIYSSTSVRAQETARPTCEILKMEPTLLDFCHENHAWADLALDEAEGRRRWAMDIPKYKRAFSSPEMLKLGHRWTEHPICEGTRFAQGIDRIARESDAFFASLGYEHDRENGVYIPVRPNDDRIALFAHQGFGLAFLSCVLDIPYPLVCTRFDMSHTGMTVIEFQQTEDFCLPRVLTLANDSHLYNDGLPTKYNNRLYF